MRNLFFFLTLLTAAHLYGQQCPEYPKLMEDGSVFFQKKVYKKALNKYNAAKLCKPSKSGEVDKMINLLFDAIEKEKDEAVLQRNIAEQEKRRSLLAEKLAKENAEKAIFEKEKAMKTSDSLKKAKTFIQKEMASKPDTSTEKQSELAAFGVILQTMAVNQENSVNNNNDVTPVSSPVGFTATVNYQSKLKFYLDAKKVLDSLNAVMKGQIQAYSKNQANDVLTNALNKRLEADIPNNVVAKFLADSTKTLLVGLKPDAKNFEDLVFIYARATLYYSWNLCDLKAYDLSKKTLDDATGFLDTIQEKTAITYYAYANIYNGYHQYFSQKTQYQEAFESISKSIAFMSKAIAMNPDNSNYQRGLSVLLRNTTFLPDTLVSQNDRLAITKLGCDCANNVVLRFPKTNNTLSVLLDCRSDQAKNQIANGNYKEALSIFQSAINTIDVLIKANPQMKNAYLEKALITTKISDLYVRNLKDTPSCLKYIEMAIKNWKSVFSNDIDPIENYARAELVYDNIVTALITLNNTKYTKKYNEAVLVAISGFSEKYKANRSIQYVSCLANKNLGELYMESKEKTDQVKTLDYFSKSIALLDNGSILKTYKDFSEDFNSFCLPYSQSVRTYLNLKEYEKATEAYNKMMVIFSDYYKKYPFDYYVVDKLKYTSMFFGAYLYKSGQYEKAIPVLNLASYEGAKSSSQQLIDIYSNPKFADSTALKLIQERIRYQSDGLKKFTIPTQFGQTKAPFDVYVVDRDPLYPYKGIDDQVEWVLRARGGVIPVEVRESFNKLQVLAWKNHVPYGELCVYALDAANEEKVTLKYKALKDTISQETDVAKKTAHYQQLYSMYEYDIKNAKDYVSIIKKDAVKFYNQYTLFQIKNNQFKSAQQLITRVYELDSVNYDAYENLRRIDFARDKKAPNKLSAPKIVKDMGFYLRFYLEELDDQNAYSMANDLIKISDTGAMRYEICKMYFDYTGYAQFPKFFLSDSARIKEFWDYLMTKDLSKLSDKDKRNFYLNMIEIDQAYLPANNPEQYKETLSQHYNSLAWYSLLSTQTEDILYYLNKSIENDPASVYPLGNLPHAYLFNNQLEKAKLLYARYKDMPFNEQGLATYKDAFLSDIKDFEAAGIKNENFKVIIDLLNQ